MTGMYTQFKDRSFSCLENPHPSCVKYLTFSHYKQQGDSKGRLPISWDYKKLQEILVGEVEKVPCRNNKGTALC
jgi:hypothetical protein